MASGDSPRRVGVAIFGVGRAGQIHLKNILNLRKAHLRYLVEENVSHGQTVAQDNLVDIDVKVISTKEAEQVFADLRVEAVIICTPTNTHEELVRRALESGKAVFCEKPIAHTLEGVQSCYEYAEKNNMPLFCAFNRRFDPCINQMRNRFHEGEIGQAQSIKTCSRGGSLPTPEYIKISGGIFHDCAIHDIDAVCWLLGERPSSVFTQAHAFHEEIGRLGDVDQVIILMKFPSGCLGSIDLSRHAAYGYDQRIEFFGSKGMLEKHNRSPTTVVRHLPTGAAAEPIDRSFTQRYRESYELEMAHFIDVLLGNEDALLVTKEETLHVCRIASACEESWRTGKVVNLSDVTSKV